MRILTTAIAAATVGGAALVGGLTLTSASAGAAETVAAVSETADATPPALGWRWFSRLTPEQKACLDKVRVTRPLGPPTDAERTQVQADLRAAAQGCGIKVPTGERRAKVEAWWKALSTEQQACLKGANLTRPLGPLSDQERRQLRTDVATAAKGCNVTLPK